MIETDRGKVIAAAAVRGALQDVNDARVLLQRAVWVCECLLQQHPELDQSTLLKQVGRSRVYQDLTSLQDSLRSSVLFVEAHSTEKIK